jgi:hypothetical protein
MSGALCGLWIDDAGQVHTAVATAAGGRETRVETLRPFAWLKEHAFATGEGITVEPLKGEGVFNRLLHAGTFGQFEAWHEQAKALGGIDVIRPLESQYLLQSRRRLFAELPFGRLRRCQLDIETGSTDGSFSDATKAGDRVLAIGLRCGGENRFIVLADDTPAAERALLEQLNAALAELDPDTIEGHNIFKFDLDFLRLRAKRHKVPCAWGRFGQLAKFRNSRLKVAERMVDFPRCDLPGRTVVDTYLLVQLHDISAREMTSYGLKAVATYLGITDDEDERTYLAGDKIQQAFNEDRAKFLAYLGDDLRETAGVADLLLPTYFEQVKTFPILLQEATLRGTTSKIDLLFQEDDREDGRERNAKLPDDGCDACSGCGKAKKQQSEMDAGHTHRDQEHHPDLARRRQQEWREHSRQQRHSHRSEEQRGHVARRHRPPRDHQVQRPEQAHGDKKREVRGFHGKAGL